MVDHVRIAMLLCALALLLLPAEAPAADVELLNGQVKPLSHSARGRAAVVQRSNRSRVLTLRNFRIDPGPRVRVWLVPRRARGDRQYPRDYIDIGALKGSRGNQQYSIPARADLRKYNTVIFWCVPFTQGLARADLRRS